MTDASPNYRRSASQVSAAVDLFVERGPIDTVLAVAAKGSGQDVLVTATREVTALFGQRGSCVLLVPFPRVAFALSAPAISDLPIVLGRYPEIVAAVHQRTVVVLENAHEDERLAPVRDRLPSELVGIVVVPLLLGEECLGVLHVQSPTAVRPSTATIATAQIVAQIAALAVDRRRLLEAALPRRDPAVGVACAGSAAGVRVLLVEDDPAQAAALSEALRDEGHLVGHLTDGDDVLAHLSKHAPDLVLLDVNLPHADGFEVAATIRTSPAGREIPLIFLSGIDDLPARVRQLDLGDIDFMPKPYSLDELFTRMARAVSEAKVHHLLRAEASHDELTGLGNLRFLRAHLSVEIARAERHAAPLSLVMIDLDKLKQINDNLGHLAGSAALRGVAEVLRREVRETDLPVRFGGDEFVVVLPHTEKRDAIVFAERALAQVRRLDVGGGSLSVSVGVASFQSGRRESGEDLLGRADAAVYRAKRSGGGRVCFDEGDAEDQGERDETGS